MNNPKELFEVSPTHIILLQNMRTDWNGMEFGSPSINPKRPYGNSDVLTDMAKLLPHHFTEYDENGDLEITDYDADRLESIHKELETALQILLHNLSIEAGYYEKPRYGGTWTKIR